MVTVQAVDCVVMPDGRTAQRGERFTVSDRTFSEECLRRFPRFVDASSVVTDQHSDDVPDLIDETADAMLAQMASQSTRRDTEQVLGGARAASSAAPDDEQQLMSWLQVERETW